MKKLLIALSFVLAVTSAEASKNGKNLVTIQITPDHYDWNYKTGSPVRFTVTLFRDQQRLRNADIRYRIGPEKMSVVQEDSLRLKDGTVMLEAKGLDNPGFLSCEVRTTVDGVEYRNQICVACECEKIRPTVTLPNDFRTFWNAQIAHMRKIPLRAKLTFMPEQSDAEVNVYHVRIPHYAPGNYLYGILCVPNREGRFPAVLRLPGAGVTKHTGDRELARAGIITFQIGIHGIPLDLAPEAYLDLRNGALRDYMYHRMEDRENYYYNRVYLGCIRANDFLTGLPQYDGEHLAAYGGSQGGALSIVTAALDERVMCLAAFYPALCDIGAYAYGRAGGWFGVRELTEGQRETLRYYDVVNFARFIRIPGFYSWGYSDETCPPTSFYSAYNQIEAPKELYLLRETGHWRYPEQNRKANRWLIERLTAH